MTLRLIHVGLGGWGQNWAIDIVAPHKDIETVAWVEIVPEALAAAQERLNLPVERCFNALEAALSSVEADVVLITASLAGHVPSAITALNAGKHVLLEKPFAPTLAEARQLVELAEQRKLILMISQNYRFYPAVVAASELIRERALGRVSAVNIDFRRYANSGAVEGNRHYQLWQPLLVDMSIHHFDLMRAVLGQEPTRISCTQWNPDWSHFVEPPAAAASITFSEGTVVNYRGSWVSTAPQTNWAGAWSMECEEGEILWTSRGERPDSTRLRTVGKRSRPVTLPDVEQIDRSGSLSAFAQAVASGIAPASSGRDNLNTLALMFAAIASAKANGQPVDIERI